MQGHQEKKTDVADDNSILREFAPSLQAIPSELLTDIICNFLTIQECVLYFQVCRQFKAQLESTIWFRRDLSKVYIKNHMAKFSKEMERRLDFIVIRDSPPSEQLLQNWCERHLGDCALILFKEDNKDVTLEHEEKNSKISCVYISPQGLINLVLDSPSDNLKNLFSQAPLPQLQPHLITAGSTIPRQHKDFQTLFAEISKCINFSFPEQKAIQIREEFSSCLHQQRSVLSVAKSMMSSVKDDCLVRAISFSALGLLVVAGCFLRSDPENRTPAILAFLSSVTMGTAVTAYQCYNFFAIRRSREAHQLQEIIININEEEKEGNGKTALLSKKKS